MLIGCFFLCSETATMEDGSTSPWLAGLRLDDFEGPTLSEQVAQAASFINADILSPSASGYLNSVPCPSMEGYLPFTTKEMVNEAHKLGLTVKPWTVSSTVSHLSLGRSGPSHIDKLSISRLMNWTSLI